MTERKIWKAEEDQILKKLHEDLGISKWSEISRMMEEVYGVEGRNGKQCRERYHNHLKNGINKDKWTESQENRLVQLHSTYGNRWSLISKLLPGRTENCVKNMLYSKMRKSMRQLNRFVLDHYRKQLKIIKVGFIYRLIQFTESFYKRENDHRNQQENMALRIKNEILRLDYDSSLELMAEQKQKIRTLICDIHLFKRDTRHYKGQHRSKLAKRRCAKKRLEQQFIEEDSQQENVKEEAQEEDQIYQKAEREQSLKPQITSNFPTHTEVDIQSRAMPLERKQVHTRNSGMSTQLPIYNRRSQSNIMRMDSLQSHISLLFEDRQLEEPIVTENAPNNLTPLSHTARQDWTSVISNWKPFQL